MLYYRENADTSQTTLRHQGVVHNEITDTCDTGIICITKCDRIMYSIIYMFCVSVFHITMK